MLAKQVLAKSLLRPREKLSLNNLNIIDLSFSADPIAILRYLLQPNKLEPSFFSEETLDIKKIKSIDVSWSYLNTQAKFSEFVIELQKASSLNMIITSPEQSALRQYLSDKLPVEVKIIIRQDTISNETPAFSPVEARAIGIYNSLPNQTMKREQPASADSMKLA